MCKTRIRFKHDYCEISEKLNHDLCSQLYTVQLNNWSSTNAIIYGRNSCVTLVRMFKNRYLRLQHRRNKQRPKDVIDTFYISCIITTLHIKNKEQ